MSVNAVAQVVFPGHYLLQAKTILLKEKVTDCISSQLKKIDWKCNKSESIVYHGIW